MEINEFCRRGQCIQTLKQFPFFNEFFELLGTHGRLIFQNQVQHLFYCFCISQKIQLIMEGKMNNQGGNISRQSIEQEILNDSLIACCLEKLMKRSKKHEGLKQQKDRKTSFFRTILKHLKSQSMVSPLDQSAELLSNLQKKLSKNTISSIDIKQLKSKFGSQIYQYLKSPKIYQDIIFNNKSQANKAFYILHLGEISLSSTLEKLQVYSFFVRQDLQNQIKRIIKNYYEDFISKNKQQNQQQNVLREDAEIFSVLDLTKKSQENSFLFPNFSLYGDFFEDSSQTKKIFQTSKIFIQ